MSGWLHSHWPTAGPLAARIDHLWWVLVAITSAVFIAVVVALVFAVRSGREGRGRTIPSTSIVRNISIAVAITVVVLFGVLIASASTGRAITGYHSNDPVAIEVTGHQWWWEVQYVTNPPSDRVTTANEIHIPTNRAIHIELRSDDVIHSFWVPNLQGKIDLIPGRTNNIWLQADRPGTYYGPCAEFCGTQHAHMALVVVAEPTADFDKWFSAQHASAPPPSTDETMRGLAVVEQGPCGLCHTIRGTSAGASSAPDLTHIASRLTLAAGTLPNNRDNLTRWLAHTQQIKPGSKMPNSGLSSEELPAVVEYLETLR
jgi:cytochrome c oxidase subunit 2